MKFLLKSLCLVVFVISTVTTLDARSKLRVIEIIDETAINEGAKRDKVRFKNEMETIARQAEMDLVFKYFNKDDFQSIGSYIDNMTVGSDDAVFLYYSGHGANTGENKWPAFSSSNITFTLKTMYRALKSKNARLTVAMFDCCNHRSAGRAVDVGGRSKTIASVAVYLFKKSQGSVIASSSEASQYSYGDPNIGGYFTDSFFRAMGDVNYSGDKSRLWHKVLDKAKSYTTELTRANTPRNRMQIPQYQIEAVVALDDEDEDGTDMPQPAPENKPLPKATWRPQG